MNQNRSGKQHQQLHSSSAASVTSSAAAGASGQALQELEVVSPTLLANVVAVASDVDGTLTTPDVTVTTRTRDAIKAVMDSGLLFFPATGKVRARNVEYSS